MINRCFERKVTWNMGKHKEVEHARYRGSSWPSVSSCDEPCRQWIRWSFQTEKTSRAYVTRLAFIPILFITFGKRKQQFETQSRLMCFRMCRGGSHRLVVIVGPTDEADGSGHPPWWTSIQVFPAVPQLTILMKTYVSRNGEKTVMINDIEDFLKTLGRGMAQKSRQLLMDNISRRTPWHKFIKKFASDINYKQPMDAGIVNAYRSDYRHRRVRFHLDAIDVGRISKAK